MRFVCAHFWFIRTTPCFVFFDRNAIISVHICHNNFFGHFWTFYRRHIQTSVCKYRLRHRAEHFFTISAIHHFSACHTQSKYNRPNNYMFNKMCSPMFMTTAWTIVFTTTIMRSLPFSYSIASQSGVFTRKVRFANKMKSCNLSMLPYI